MTLEEKTGKNYISHSAMSTWLNCGWSYYLSRIQKVPENPSYWLVGGKSVHECTEWYDRMEPKMQQIADVDCRAVFVDIWQKNYDLANNGMPFRAGGRSSKQYPNKEDASWWLEHGPKMFHYWIEWRKQERPYTPYLLSDGTFAVETELNVEVGGVLMKGFLDRLMVSPEGELTVIDIKTSTKEPASHTQLGTYAVMCEKTIGVRPTKGAYFMARTGELTTPVDLDHYTESRLGSHLRGFKIAIDNNIFIPQPGFMCGTCSVSHACYAVKGKDSHKYPELGEINE
jgi:putative RecB family exonuclease